MRYSTYKEEQEIVKQGKYAQVKQILLAEQPNKKCESYSLRKLRFMQSSGERLDDAEAKYYICLKDQDDEQIYIEKKYEQNEVIYKSCEKITREETERILDRDVEWMKNHKKTLLADFYLQYTLNDLEPKHITEYTREKMKLKKGSYITFAHKISRIAGGETDIFSDNGIPIQCLAEADVSISYKHEITLPQMIMNLIQTTEDVGDELAFAF